MAHGYFGEGGEVDLLVGFTFYANTGDAYAGFVLADTGVFHVGNYFSCGQRCLLHQLRHPTRP